MSIQDNISNTLDKANSVKNEAEARIQDAKNLIANSQNNLQDSIKNIGATAQQAVSSSISGLISALPSSLDSFTKSITSNDITKKLTEVANKVNTDFTKLSGDVTGLTNNGSTTSPLIFAASATKKMIESIDLPFGDLGINLDNIANGTKEKLKELAGGSFDNPLSAIKEVKNNIQKTISEVTGKGQSLLNGMKGMASGVLDPIKDTLGSVSDFVDPNNIKNLVSSNLDFLPDNITSMISSSVGNVVGQLDSKVGNLQSLCNLDNLTQKLLHVSSFGNDYNQITDVSGNIIPGLSNKDTNSNDLSDLYKLAKKVCPNVEDMEFSDWGTQKDLYDILIGEALENGASNLLDDLLNCDKYFDNRTKKVLQKGLDTATKSGNPYLVNSIQNSIGNSNISNTKTVALTLGTNLQDTNKTTIEEFFKASTSLGLQKDALVTDDVQHGAISAEYVTLLSRKPEIINEILNEDKRNTVLQIYQLYA